MYVAVVGCGHGKLTEMYKEISKQEATNPEVKVQLLIICGDFQVFSFFLSIINRPPEINMIFLEWLVQINIKTWKIFIDIILVN